MSESTILYVDIDDEEVECNIQYRVDNNGIGPYEYWGQTCYDKGEDYIEIEDIHPIFTNESEEDKIRINSYIKDNFKEISSNLIDNWEYPELPERDFDE